MKLCYYSPTYPDLTGSGGIGTYTKLLAEQLVKVGHAVFVITPSTLNRQTTINGVEVHEVCFPPSFKVEYFLPGLTRSLFVYRYLRRLVLDKHIDCVEFPNWDGVGWIFAVLSKVPTVVRLSTSSKEAGEIDGTTNTKLVRSDIRRERWQSRWATHLVTHSQCHAALMSNELGSLKKEISLIPLGIKIDRGRLPKVAPFNQRLLSVGRLENRKGTYDLLQALRLVIDVYPECKLVLLGDDREHAPGGRSFRQYVSETFEPDYKRCIEFISKGTDAQLAEAYANADIFVAPSHYESFGLMNVEAMSFKLPVVSTFAGAIPEVVLHEKTGLLVPPASPNLLATEIIRLFESASLREKLGNAGFERAQKLYSVEVFADQMANLYSSLMQRNGLGA